MTEEVGIPAELQGVPATAKIVYLALDRAEEPLTTHGLSRLLRTPERSIRSGLADLDEEGLIGTDGDPTTPAYFLK